MTRNLNDLCKRCGAEHETIRCPNKATILRRDDIVRHRGNGRLGRVAKKISNSTDYMVNWLDGENPKWTTTYPGWVEKVETDAAPEIRSVDEILKDRSLTDGQVAARVVGCPKCHAVVGSPCRSVATRKLVQNGRRSHPERMTAFHVFLVRRV